MYNCIVDSYVFIAYRDFWEYLTLDNTYNKEEVLKRKRIIEKLDNYTKSESVKLLDIKIMFLCV